MTREEKHEHWEKIVSEAYQSGIPISQWCREHSIHANHFYHWTKKLGYTSNGKRTEKCNVLSKDQSRQVPTPVAISAPLFVEISTQAMEEISSPADVFPSLPNQPFITIQAGNYQIGIHDGFDENTLSKVLKVVRYA